MNSQNVNELIDILGRETGIYEELLKISKDKTELIVKGKVDELDEITKLEQNYIADIGKLEYLREKTVKALTETLGVNHSDITISELIKHLNKDNAKELEECKKNLIDIIEEIKSVNELNSKLIQNSIDYINFSINILSSVPETNNNYGNTGDTKEGVQRNYFDVKL